jgi:glycosyltransferase involved in cell wall biosynthesis
MRITFLMPGYPSGPSGGYKVVYEYANRLVKRGHEVTVVHPRHLKYAILPERLTLRNRVRRAGTWMNELLSKPQTEWHEIDGRVRMKFVESSSARLIPHGDAVFATSWQTVRSVLKCPPNRGNKFYLIQGYETWDGHKDLVDATWRSPLHKVVVSKWLLDLGKELGASDVTYIPNAVDDRVYRLHKPMEERPFHVAMTFSALSIKGGADGIKALTIARESFPELKVVFFGKDRRQASIPEWIQYYREPAQGFLVNEIYNGSRIFLSPSWSEGFALPPAEAASCGCAIVATDSGGIRDYVENGVTGLLSPAQDAGMLAQNLCLLLGNQYLLEKLAEAGRQAVKSLSWERSADLLETLICGTGKPQVERDAIAH